MSNKSDQISEAVVGYDYFTPREWAALPRTGSSGSSMANRNACIHNVLFNAACAKCADLEQAYQRRKARR